jgi:hypothetical protein
MPDWLSQILPFVMPFVWLALVSAVVIVVARFLLIRSVHIVRREWTRAEQPQPPQHN